MRGLNFKKVFDVFKKVLAGKKEDIKNEEIELLKKKIRDDVQKGHDIKEIEKELNKRYPKSFVEFLLKDLAKKEKADIEWLKGYRREIEAKKESETYQGLVSYMITSLICASIFYYSTKKLEDVFGVATGFEGIFSSLIVGFKLAFWTSVAAFVVSLGILTYKRYMVYKQAKKMFAESKLKGDHKELEGEKKPKEQQVEKKPELAGLAKGPIKIYRPITVSPRGLSREYILSAELREKLRRISKGGL